jgi:hypothetical protein
VLVEDDPARSLGGALAWAHQQGADHLHVVAEGKAAGVLARRARYFASPPTIWRVVGAGLEPAEPEPHAEPPTPPPAAVALGEVLGDAGATVVHEHGVVLGEVLGLEIARVVVDDRGEPRIEVGVGRNDRDAFALLHGDTPAPEAVADVVATVQRHRNADASEHPLQRLAPERWLREVVVTAPALVGANQLHRIAGPVARTNLKESLPAPAAGIGADGEPVVVVCSVGVDLDLVPAAADARAAHDPAARLVLVVPARDDQPVTQRLASALAEPATVVAIAGDWRTAGR